MMDFIYTAYAAEIQEVTEGTNNAQEGILASLGINLSLFIFQLINFAIVVLILWFLILKPLTKTLTQRQKMIDESIENSQKTKETLSKSEEKYQKCLSQAESEANKILEKAVEESEKVSQDLRGKTQKDIQAMVEQAKHNIRTEKENMTRDLKKETTGLVVLALEKILKEKVDLKKDKELIEEAIKSLKS